MNHLTERSYVATRSFWKIGFAGRGNRPAITKIVSQNNQQDGCTAPEGLAEVVEVRQYPSGLLETATPRTNGTADK